MFLTLLMLIAVFLFDPTPGKAFGSQRNNRDIYLQDLRGMQCTKEMLWRNQANFYMNPLTSATSDSFAFERSSVPIPNDNPASTIEQLSVPNDDPASTIKQLSVPNDGPAHFKQLSVPKKSLTTTPRNLFLLRNKDNSEIMTPCLLHPTKSATKHAIPRNLLLLYVRNEPAIMVPSLLLVCIRDAPAIMMAPLANFSLQLIVENPSLLLFCVSIVGR